MKGLSSEEWELLCSNPDPVGRKLGTHPVQRKVSYAEAAKGEAAKENTPAATQVGGREETKGSSEDKGDGYVMVSLSEARAAPRDEAARYSQGEASLEAVVKDVQFLAKSTSVAVKDAAREVKQQAQSFWDAFVPRISSSITQRSSASAQQQVAAQQNRLPIGSVLMGFTPSAQRVMKQALSPGTGLGAKGRLRSRSDKRRGMRPLQAAADGMYKVASKPPAPLRVCAVQEDVGSPKSKSDQVALGTASSPPRFVNNMAMASSQMAMGIDSEGSAEDAAVRASVGVCELGASRFLGLTPVFPASAQRMGAS